MVIWPEPPLPKAHQAEIRPLCDPLCHFIDTIALQVELSGSPVGPEFLSGLEPRFSDVLGYAVSVHHVKRTQLKYTLQILKQGIPFQPPGRRTPLVSAEGITVLVKSSWPVIWQMCLKGKEAGSFFSDQQPLSLRVQSDYGTLSSSVPTPNGHISPSLTAKDDPWSTWGPKNSNHPPLFGKVFWYSPLANSEPFHGKAAEPTTENSEKTSEQASRMSRLSLGAPWPPQAVSPEALKRFSNAMQADPASFVRSSTIQPFDATKSKPCNATSVSVWCKSASDVGTASDARTSGYDLAFQKLLSNGSSTAAGSAPSDVRTSGVSKPGLLWNTPPGGTPSGSQTGTQQSALLPNSSSALVPSVERSNGTQQGLFTNSSSRVVPLGSQTGGQQPAPFPNSSSSSSPFPPVATKSSTTPLFPATAASPTSGSLLPTTTGAASSNSSSLFPTIRAASTSGCLFPPVATKSISSSLFPSTAAASTSGCVHSVSRSPPSPGPLFTSTAPAKSSESPLLPSMATAPSLGYSLCPSKPTAATEQSSSALFPTTSPKQPPICHITSRSPSSASPSSSSLPKLQALRDSIITSDPSGNQPSFPFLAPRSLSYSVAKQVSESVSGKADFKHVMCFCSNGCLSTPLDGPSSISPATKNDGLSFFEQRSWPDISFGSPSHLSDSQGSEKAQEKEERVLDGNETLHRDAKHTARLSGHGGSDSDSSTPAADDGYNAVSIRPDDTYYGTSGGVENSPTGSEHVTVGCTEHSIPLDGTEDTENTAAAYIPLSTLSNDAASSKNSSDASVETVIPPDDQLDAEHTVSAAPAYTPVSIPPGDTSGAERTAAGLIPGVGASGTDLSSLGRSPAHWATESDDSGENHDAGIEQAAASTSTPVSIPHDIDSGIEHNATAGAQVAIPAGGASGIQRSASDSSPYLVPFDTASGVEHASSGSVDAPVTLMGASDTEHAFDSSTVHSAAQCDQSRNGQAFGSFIMADSTAIHHVSGSYHAPTGSAGHTCPAGKSPGTYHASGTFLAPAAGKNDALWCENAPAGPAGIPQPSSDIASLPECPTSNTTATGLQAQCPADSATECKSNLSDQDYHGASTVDQCSTNASTDAVAVNSDVGARTTAAAECISPAGVFSSAGDAYTRDTMSAHKQSCAAKYADPCDNQSESELSAAVEPREGSDSDSGWLVLHVNDKEQIQDCTGMS